MFPQIGEFKEHAIEAIRNIQKHGHQVVLWTCREGYYLEEARKAIEKEGLILNGYNYSPYQLQSRKIVADVYVDDKNVLMVDNVDWYKIEEYILNLKDNRVFVSKEEN